MTVGIAAIAESQHNPKAIVAADRMVTIGERSGVEYEDSDSKIESFIHTDDLAAVAVGAGTSTYIDEILDTLHTYVAHPDNQPATAREAMNLALVAYKNTVQETINNQVSAAYNFDLADLRDDDVSVPNTVQKAIVNEAQNIRDETAKRVTLLVTAVGTDGAGIYRISGGDFTNFTDTGYSIIGSGADSARLTFTRRQYSKTTTKRDGLFTVLEAKRQAEERQGVGQRMDLATIEQGQIRTIDQVEEEKLAEYLDRIQLRENEARAKVMENATLDFI